jgi:hypothetical protein
MRLYNISSTFQAWMTVMEAETICAAEGSTLTSIQAVNEFEPIFNLIRNQSTVLSEIFVGNNMRYGKGYSVIHNDKSLG